jgi:hypothetical protein
MINSVCEPHPKGRLCEEHIPLTQHIELRISIQHASRHELIKYTNDQWWQDGEEDIVKRESPGLVRNHARKVVTERVLDRE